MIQELIFLRGEYSFKRSEDEPGLFSFRFL